MPEIYPFLAAIEYWVMGVIGAIILFISVLLHELAHSFVALKYGLKVRQIVLFIFGGVSDIEEEESSKDFRKEFKIAVVGPLTSFVIAGILALSLSILNQVNVEDTIVAITIAEGVLYYGTLVNVLIGGFNLIPAFPLDGGRILRSALLRWKKDYDQSTKIATKVGIAISYGFMALGFVVVFTGSFISGMWLLLIGWFLNSGAQSYLAQQELSSILSGVRLGNIMNTKVISVKEDITIDRLIKDYFNVYAKDSFPVVNDFNYLLGMVTFKDAMKVSDHRRGTLKAIDIMIPKTNLIIMNPNRTADDVLIQMTRNQMARVFVCNEEGRLIGLASKTDIMNAASERKEYMKAVKKFAENK